MWSICHRDNHVASSRERKRARQAAKLARDPGVVPKQRDVGQTRRALTGHGQRWRQWHGFRDEVRRDLVALLFQERRGGLHLGSIALLCPHTHERRHRRIHGRQCHQRLPYLGIANIDRQAGQSDVEKDDIGLEYPRDA